MYVCISITELMVFIFIDCFFFALFSKLPGGHFYFLTFYFLYRLTLLSLGLLMELMTYNVFMLQSLQPVGLH